MSGKLFREFVSLFKEWPIDTGKGSRCLGVYIRKHFSQHFQRGELSENVNVQEWSKTLHDLKQISNDVYLKRYPRERKTGALGKGEKKSKTLFALLLFFFKVFFFS
jgi:hypothetical protein